MALTNEDLLALSDLLDKKLDAKLQPLENDIRDIKLEIENTIKPQLNLLTENYVSAAKKYEKTSAQIDAIQVDVKLLKKVVSEHSIKLQNMS